MHSAWETFREAGFTAWFSLLFGLMGGLAALAALVLTAMRSRVALWVGVAAVMLGALSATAGGFGVMYGRRMTEAALAGDSVSPRMKERIRLEGYRESRSAAKVGLFFAWLPLLAGIAAMFAAPRRKATPEAPIASPAVPTAPKDEGLGLGVPIGATALGALSAVFAFAALRAPLPGPDIPYDSAHWKVLDEIDRVTAATDPEAIIRACDELQIAAYVGSTADPSQIAEFPAAAQKCVETSRKQARLAPSIHETVRRLEALSRSGFVQKDPELRRQVEADLEEVRKIAQNTPETMAGTGDPGELGPRKKPPKVRMGATKVTGRLPPEVIQRIVRQNFGRFRLCYENGLRNNPKLAGRVVVKFAIGKDGSASAVTNGGSDLPDAGVVSCVVRAFYGLSFPQPEGGIVIVEYPIMFSPPEDG